VLRVCSRIEIRHIRHIVLALITQKSILMFPMLGSCRLELMPEE
jgi:hypothetical protein